MLMLAGSLADSQPGRGSLVFCGGAVVAKRHCHCSRNNVKRRARGRLQSSQSSSDFRTESAAVIHRVWCSTKQDSWFCARFPWSRWAVPWVARRSSVSSFVSRSSAPSPTSP
ncbi:hypothetical protein WMY93_032127 [Mugilogobius chulae]|uniref:Secreted protein n=1 Tax=Mugilogobius chulae TaxID=88201 RepID=A0AAW0MCJ9_9GOBI